MADLLTVSLILDIGTGRDERRDHIMRNLIVGTQVLVLRVDDGLRGVAAVVGFSIVIIVFTLRILLACNNALPSAW